MFWGSWYLRGFGFLALWDSLGLGFLRLGGFLWFWGSLGFAVSSWCVGGLGLADLEFYSAFGVQGCWV